MIGDIEGCDWLMNDTEPNPLANHEHDVPVVLIIEELVALLCLL
jgi:hypothetical protein